MDVKVKGKGRKQGEESQPGIEEGDTPLHLAVLGSHVAVVRDHASP